MKNKLFFASLAMALAFGSCQKDQTTTLEANPESKIASFNEEVISSSYVIVYSKSDESFKKAAVNYREMQLQVEDVTKKKFANAGITFRQPDHIYGSTIKGIAVRLTNEELNRLKADNTVKIYPDKMVTLAKPTTDVVTQPAEVLPYGVVRTGYAIYTGTHKAWIIDTGIDTNHPDLNVNTSLGYLAPGIRATSFEDDNGHGTHCAGIVAAIDNTIGVVGVAAGAQVVPIKVLDKRGSGAYSSIIAGVDYVAANATPGDVANMSLGGGVYEPIDLAVQALGEKGVFVALAAGNESDDANNHSPARANGPNLYTVSAMDSADTFAYFSNYGNPPVDYCAPGVNIFSTYKGDTYATMSGTSMAAPHVCGLLLLTNGNIVTDGYVLGDPDGNPDPIAHK